MAEKAFEKLMTLVRNERGLDLSSYKENFLLRRLNSRFRILEIDNLGEYCRFLESHHEEYSKLIDVLAINVTEFFRDPPVFDLFEKKIIPELILSQEYTHAKILRFLSAGGASGEEAYSIAIKLHEALGTKINNYSISILLADIDPDCIEKAKDGIYVEDHLKNVPASIKSKYFKHEGNLYQVKPEIRKMVTMTRMDLLTDRIPKFFNVIFCRNLLIYFSKEGHSDIFMRLYNSLTNDGFMVLGRTETLLGTNKSLFDTYDAKERVYRKRPTAFYASRRSC
ncbi:MAG: protein-glutamate O-methyltransferase CheR [Thermoplasmata archaeon]|nr:protein-glutamate O-methyltransferase CheR [Thermoplasmata archaeon]